MLSETIMMGDQSRRIKVPPEFFGKIVDAHAHSDRKLSWKHTPEQLLSMMKECGIAKSAVMPYWDLPAPGDPEAVERFERMLFKYSAKFYGFLRLNPFSPQAEGLLSEFVVKKIIQGVKFNPSTNCALPYAEPTMKLVRKAAEYSLPVLFHSGDDPLSSPLQIAKAAQMCPNASIIIGHMGGYFYIDEAIEVAYKLKNVFLETSIMPYPSYIRLAALKVGSQKVFFGSDSPGVHARVEIAKILASGLAQHHLEKILISGFQGLIEDCNQN
jgi:predicted TIM-barrel fold metal-dependent hydrolase